MENPAQDEVRTVAGPSPSIAFRRAPRAGPAANGWPGGPDDRLTVRIDPQQPTLPWDGNQDSEPTSVRASDIEAPARSTFGAIRILRFGGSWVSSADARAPRPRLPDPAAWSIRLADALMEAVAGIRPVSQLDRWLAPPAMAQLTRRARRRTAGERAGLRAIHLHRDAGSRTEVVAVFDWPDRTAAMAFRLDAVGSRWMCTALELSAMRRPKRTAIRSVVSRPAGSRSSRA